MLTRSRRAMSLGLALALLTGAPVAAKTKARSRVEKAAPIPPSSNWAGYAVTSRLGKITAVHGSWTVPSVTCDTPTSSSAIWVGIGGVSSRTLEQVGTDQSCENGKAVYTAWYESLPELPVMLTMPLRPGDHIATAVEFTAPKMFTLKIDNLTTGGTFSISRKRPFSRRTSAEWIVEAPYSRLRGVVPLTNFGAVRMTGSSVTLDGHTGSINDPAWPSSSIAMETVGGKPKASPGPLSSNGSAFTVTWAHH